METVNDSIDFPAVRTPEKHNIVRGGILMQLVFSILLAFLTMTSPPVHAKDNPLVFVSILPQKYFVEQIGKDLVDIEVMVMPGANPATYEPKPAQMTHIANASAYFAIGVPFEKVWLKRISSANPKMPVIRTDHGIAKIPIAAHLHPGDKTDPGTPSPHSMDHPHSSGLDPHIWLSPPLVMLQARTILTALQEIDPIHQGVYEANYKAFIMDILDLDANLRKSFIDRQGLTFMVFHPSWGYFAQSYGLKQLPIEIEGKEPKPAQLAELIQHARKENIRVVFVQPQFSTKTADQIAKAINGQVIVTDPLAFDWPKNLRAMAVKLKTASESSDSRKPLE